MRSWIPLLCASCVLVPAAAAQDSAPSSHFVFDDNFDGDMIINEVRVPKGGEAMYTYYEALGWRGKGAGYAGIQVHPKAHLFIFSIWDHKDHTAPIRAVHRGPGTKTVGFGGEGTGLKSWNFDLGWKADVWYTLVARCWPVGDHTHYGFWTRAGDTKQWTHLVTMDVAAKNARFRGGTDAFIEDWLNTGKNPRTTNLKGGWKRKMDGTWYPFQKGRYSVNFWDLDPGKRSFNYKTSWNGGVAKDKDGTPFYFMVSGGKKTSPTVKNPSQHAIRRTDRKPSFGLIKIKSAKATLQKNEVTLTWEFEPTSTPQFEYSATIFEKNGGDKKKFSKTERLAHARSAKLNLAGSDLVDRTDFVHLSCTDIFGNKSTQIVNIRDSNGK